MSATTKTEQGAQVPTVDHVIRQGPSADGLWAEFQIGGTVGFTAVKRGKTATYPRLKISVRIIKLAYTDYRNRFFFEGELVSAWRNGGYPVQIPGFYVVGCYETSSQSGWIEAKRGQVSR